MRKFVVRSTFALSFLTFLGLVAPSVHAQLTIIPTFDSSITNDPNAATIENSINSVLQIYKTDFSNPITVSILFQEGGGLGSSSTLFGTISYSQYLAALQADPNKTSNDNIALANLPAGPNNPVNGNPNMDVSTANLRALGFSVNLSQGQFDSTITLNTSIMNLSRTGPQNPGKYDLQSVAMHEIDEALGFGSALNGLANGAANPTGPVLPEDLFRFDQNGQRTLSTNVNTQAFFSIDGGHTDLAQFNQTAGGDFSDWKSDPLPPGAAPKVQDAFATPGAAPNLGVELTALDVIGYDLKIAAVPEISSLGILGMGLSGMVLLLRRRRA